MNRYVFCLRDIDRTNLILAGGKGANLGELSKIEGIVVPEGFCINSGAYKRVIGNDPEVGSLLDELSQYKAEDRAEISRVSAKIRAAIEVMPIPVDMADEMAEHITNFGEGVAFAVRSSATAEDLPTASFAGQQDTYLNITGKEAVFQHITKCWASLFTDRAVVYRIQHGFDHRTVYLAVVVQKMVLPRVAGVMFTADPVSSNRKVVSIDAAFGLGEELVSGLVDPDNYRVRNGKIIDKKISAREPGRRTTQALKDAQILELEKMGRKIEEHFGYPQDIEWCLAGDMFYIVQSRPITTLFPIPEAGDRATHVYLSVGHQQMMTDAMKPLGISLWQSTALAPMFKAAGRLFVDVTQRLASPAGRSALLEAMEKHDPLMKDALMAIIGRGDLIKEEDTVQNEQRVSPAFSKAIIEYDPAIVSELIHRNQASKEELKRKIQGISGTDLFDLMVEDFLELKKITSNPQSTGVYMTAINASAWINEKMKEWLGETNVADTISQSVPNNITSEMGLALLDVADVIRPYPDVIHYLRDAADEIFFEGLDKVRGGREARDAIQAFLTKYGMRCPGEIDITRPRWSERPTTLVPLILNNIKNFEVGAAARKYEQGRQEALKKEQALLHRLRQLPDGEEKARETKRMIDLVRNFIGYREYPKYGIVSRYFVYKQALLREAGRLVRLQVINRIEDVYYLSFDEFREVVQTNKLEPGIIARRKIEHELFEKLTPPRVITSDGEIVMGEYNKEGLPPDAIAGLPVSAGVIEGRARVILKMEDAELGEGDILVTAFTDPSWTPLFVSISGLVTEVGGLMTHGAVIAREYGLPAIVGVRNATTLIKDGQRIRVNGTEGYVEIV